MNSSLVRLSVFAILCLGAAVHAQTRSMIVITDMEPDDRVLIDLHRIGTAEATWASQEESACPSSSEQ